MTDQGGTKQRDLARLAELEQIRDELAELLDALDVRRHHGIRQALAHGATLTEIAAVLAISRQALSRYLNRREAPNARPAPRPAP